MTYKFLAGDLEEAAEAAKQFMRIEWGIPDSRILVEAGLADHIRAAPTLQAKAQDHHVLAIEISDNLYPPQLDGLLVDCNQDGFPVKLYMGVPASTQQTSGDVARLTSKGVGILVIDSKVRVVNSAVSLSLFGVRKPDPKRFPARYRQVVSGAYQTFLSGEPAQGCTCLYIQIEDITRRIAVKATKKGWWRSNAPKPPDADSPKTSLKVIARFISDYLSPTLARTKKLDGYLLDRVPGVVGHRNDHAHPTSTKALRKRNLELRTRFESATDLLADLIAAAAPLKV